MKRIILIILLCQSYWMATAQKTSVYSTEGEITITGKIGNINSPQQLWIYMGDLPNTWDTIPITNGVFTYKKKTLLPAYGAIMVKYKPYYNGVEGYTNFFGDMNMLSMFFEDGHMEINSPVDSLRKHAVISGSASMLYHQYREYWDKEGDIIADQKKIAAEFNQAKPEQLQSEEFLAIYEEKNANIQERLDSLIRWQVETHPKSLPTQMAFMRYLRKYKDNIRPETAREIYDLIPQEIKESRAGADMVALIGLIGKPEEVIPVVSVGDIAPEFEELDLKRRAVKLSDFRGQYVLLDFWASWCKPCRKVNPELVELYKQFKSDDFTILGVSLDKDEDAWKEAVKEDDLKWHHVSALKDTQSEAVKQYGIRAIPQNLLIDPEGRVIMKNAKVADLKVKLLELL